MLWKRHPIEHSSHFLLLAYDPRDSEELDHHQDHVSEFWAKTKFRTNEDSLPRNTRAGMLQ